MISYPLKDVNNQDLGQVELSDGVFGRAIRKDLLARVVQYQLASARQGTASTKGRSEVRGGGRKPYRQKGTGNARQGTIRAPQFRTGGIVFGPKPRDYSIKMLKKERRLALQTALSLKVDASQLVVLDALVMETISTKRMKQILDGVGVSGSVLIVLGQEDLNVSLSVRNLPKVDTIRVEGVNAYDLLSHEFLISTQETLAKLEERLA